MLAKLVRTALGFYIVALVVSFIHNLLQAFIKFGVSSPLQIFLFQGPIIELIIRWALLLVLVYVIGNEVVKVLEGKSPNLVIPAVVLLLIGGYEAVWGNSGGVALIFAASLLIVAKFLPMLTVVAVVASAVGLYYAWWHFLDRLSAFGPFGEVVLVVIAAVVYYLPEFLGLASGRGPDEAELHIRKLGLAALGLLFSIGVVVGGFQAVQLGISSAEKEVPPVITTFIRVVSLVTFTFFLLAGLLGVVAVVDVMRKTGLPRLPPPPPRLPPPPPPPPPRPPPPSETVVMGESDVEVRPYREEEE